MHGLHDYLKYVKYGFGRTTDHACIDIRNNRLTREDGIKLVKEFEGKYPNESINAFIEYSGLPKTEIDRIIDSYTNTLIFKHDNNGNFLKDEKGNLVKDSEVI